MQISLGVKLRLELQSKGLLEMHRNTTHTGICTNLAKNSLYKCHLNHQDLQLMHSQPPLEQPPRGDRGYRSRRDISTPVSSFPPCGSLTGTVPQLQPRGEAGVSCQTLTQATWTQGPVALLPCDPSVQGNPHALTVRSLTYSRHTCRCSTLLYTPSLYKTIQVQPSCRELGLSHSSPWHGLHCTRTGAFTWITPVQIKGGWGE